jgi:pimeloyl-ACP methyl ester carboxylesterase
MVVDCAIARARAPPRDPERTPSSRARWLCAQAPHPGLRVFYFGAFQFGAFQVPWLPEAGLRAANYLALRQALRLTSRSGTFSTAELARYRDAWAQPNALTGMLNWYRALRLKRRSELGPIRLPTMIIWGKKEPALSPHLATESLKLCETGRIEWLPKATHWLHHEEPAQMNNDLESFLAR